MRGVFRGGNNKFTWLRSYASRSKVLHVDESYKEAFKQGGGLSKGSCVVVCNARKYDWTTLQFPEGKKDWLVLKKEEFVLAKERKTGADVFFFPYGVTVVWGASKDDTQRLMREVESFAPPVSPMKSPLMEDWTFEVGEKDSLLVDSLQLSRHTNALSARLAFSTGLAQSAKLQVFEEQVDAAIAMAERIPEQLAQYGQLRLSRRDINRKYGQLLTVRASANLHSDILDLPEFFFELPDGHETYGVVRRYLQVAQRAKVLNDRLQLIQELYRMLGEDRSQEISHRLEWLIIALITVEVILAVGSKLADKKD